MHIVNRIFSLLMAAAFALAPAVHAQQSAAQTPYKAPRTSDGKPDLQGIWMARNAAAFDVSEIADGRPIHPPYRPAPKS